MNENKAVDYYDVVLDKESGLVLDFRAHRSNETPQEEINRINMVTKQIDLERLLFESMIETPVLINAAPIIEKPVLIF
jgi:hypothetical protein